MGYSFPEGSSQQFSKTFTTAKNITAITNADPAVASCAGHGLADDDEILLTVGWEDATDSVYRIEVLTADTFAIVDLDTTDEDFFPVSGAKGTVQKVSDWSVIPQVLTIGTSGGDAKFTDVAPLARRNALKFPVGFNATAVTLTLGHDAKDLVYKDMLKITRRFTKVAFKQVIKGGATTYGYGYLAVAEFPKLTANSVNTVDASMALLGRSISY